MTTEPSGRMHPLAAVQAISDQRGDAVVIPTMSAFKLWARVTTRPELDLPLFGAMGKASSLGLGVALARPDRRVIVLDGDGSLLMNLGALVTIGAMAPANLSHFVFENDVYETTGGQPVPGARRFDLAAIAKGSGYPRTVEFDDAGEFAFHARELIHGRGPTFVCLKVIPVGGDQPFPPRKLAEAIPEVKAALAAASAKE